MRSQKERTDTPPRDHPERKSQWRQVLGKYPTGVTIITTVDEAGQPVGMIVGTFTSVSEDPPLVGFLPQKTSFTYAKIESAGRFRASVLGAGHEELCRAFFRAAPNDRFAGEGWEFDEGGIPRLKDAVAWFDATVHNIHPAGDHVMVLGEVMDFGLGPRTGGLPLVFLNGGYGSFTIPRQDFNLDNLGGQLRLATSLGDEVEELSHSLGLECSISTVVQDTVVVLTASDSRSPYVGTYFPFVAPIDPGFAAWSTPALHRTWTEGSRHLRGRVDAALIEEILTLVRKNGYAISFGHTRSEQFSAAFSSAKGDWGTLSPVWDSLVSAYEEYCRHPEPAAHATLIQVPVFGQDQCVAFEIVVSGFGPGATRERFREIVSRTLDCAARLTDKIGGRAPSDYSIQLP